MERGLLWLPLLGVFMALAWSGAREYQKLEAYQAWARDFAKSKYDIYTVLGLQGHTLTWGQPTPQGPKNLQSFSLEEVQQVSIFVKGKEAELVFALNTQDTPIKIPFTQADLAEQWLKYLQQFVH